MAAQGKIGRLPVRIREELCRRLLDNEPAAQVILPWLNGLKETQDILATQFDGKPISETNLSIYRSTAFAEWMEKQESVDRVRKLTEFASRLGAAAQDGISQGTLALANGKILEILEGAAEDDPELALAMLKNLPKLSNEEVKHKRLALAKETLEQRKADADIKRQQLDQNQMKLELNQVEIFMEWINNAEAQEILNSKKPRNVKLADLRKIFFRKAE
jgi:Holliday junction resolvase